jgi:hypothetical protein
MSFDSRAITGGIVGRVIDNLIAELVALGAIEELSKLAKKGELV